MNPQTFRRPQNDQQRIDLPDNGTVRSQVSDTTRQLHVKLSSNPKLQRLLSPQLTNAEYQDVISRFLSFFIAAESRRVALNCFSGHSLFPDICLLSADTGTIPEPLPRLPKITDKWQCLGMLYVLHGARFGAKMMQSNVCTQLPDRPHYYIAQEQTPHQWRLIVMQMEHAAQEPAWIEAMSNSALETFEVFDQWLSAIGNES